MFKPSFAVVTSLLIVFAVLAFARHIFERFIPPVATNRLADSPQPFLSAAGHQSIDWNLIDEGAIPAARVAGKPILLVIGISTGPIERELGTIAFDDVDTARFISQNFFCIRIDGFENPEWLNAVLPFSRLKIGMKAGFQAWILHPDGRVFRSLSRGWGLFPNDAQGLLRTLVKDRDDYNSEVASSNSAQVYSDLQASDLNALSHQPQNAAPNFTFYGENLRADNDPKHGGFPQMGSQALFPNAWRYMTLTGNFALWSSSLAPLLCSRLVDVQDGGFFRVGLNPEISTIEFDKLTCQNADMMFELALAARLNRYPFAESLSRSTFDWLVSSENTDGLLAAAQEDDENPQGRSPRLSFPSWRLGDCLTEPDRAWAVDQLGLEPSSNPQMTPYLKSPTTLSRDKETYERVVEAFRAATTNPPMLSDDGYLDVNGHSIARMLQVARLWGDPGRSQAAVRMAGNLSRFKTDVDLIHRVDDRDRRPGYLSDFLGFADAQLQLYLATGETAAFQEGLHYLNLARRLFRGHEPGSLNLCRNADSVGGIESFCVPEIADNLSESCTAASIRLLLAYGRLTSDTVDGRAMLHEARESTSLFAVLAAAGGPETGGYFCAAAEVLDGKFAIAVGPQARGLSDSLYRLIPTRFVAPAIGAIRKDLQAKKPGVYIIGDQIQGPLSVAQAAQLLPPTMSIPPGQ